MEAQALGSTPSHPGVCGRHGGEEARVTQGDLALSDRQVWSGACDTCRRKGREQGTPPSTWSHRAVGADRSGSAVPAEAVPGVGAGRITQERGQNKRPRIAAGSRGAAGHNRPGGGGRPRALLRVGNAEKRRVGTGRLESSLRARPHTRTEDTVTPQDPPTSTTEARKKQKVHALLDKVYSRQNPELAWEKVQQTRGSAGIDDVTIAAFEARQAD